MTDTEFDAIAVARRVIETEIAGLGELSASIGAEFSEAIDVVGAAQNRIVCAGVGKSGHVARKMAATLASTGAPAQFVHPTEASHGDLGMVSRGDVILALSKSGETQELGDMIHYARRFEIPLIAITAKRDSTLGNAANIVLEVPDAPEACAATRAPTTSTTLMMALGDALAVALLERRGFGADDFKIFHPGGKLGAMLRRVADIMHRGDQVPLVASGTPMAEALEMVSSRGLGCVGVTEPGGALIGIVTDGDVRRLVARGRMVTTIDDAMTRDPIVLAPDMLVSAALNLLNARNITQAMVVEDGRPVGVVHMHDFLRAGVA